MEMTLHQALLRAAEHADKGEFAQVRTLCEAVLKALPSAAAAARQSGNPPQAMLDALLLLYRQGQWGAAAEQAEALARTYPQAPTPWNVMGAANAQLGRNSLATQAFSRAIAVDPNAPDAHNNLGNMLKREGKLHEAAAAYRQALRLNPTYADAHSNLGIVLHAQGQCDAAIAAYRQALAIMPSHAEASYNLGIALRDQGKIDEALAAYEHALAIKPDFAAARLNRGLAWLVQGKFAKGWPEFEWRWKQPDTPKPRASGKPLWLGQQSLAGKTILLWGEQGLGDQIQFARYVPLVAALGGRVILEVQAPLVALLSGIPGAAQVISADAGLPDDAFDYHCPLMSLPLAFQTELGSIPAPVQITAQADRAGPWQSRLGARRPRIGIAWSGNAQHKNDGNRSIPFARLAALLDDTLGWISLQKEVRPQERGALDLHPPIRHFGDELHDFVDTAALCAQCDLVISVDTGVAHLAASLGRTVWLLLPFAPDWRWLLGRDDSPWYPSMTLYRQDRIGDWDGVLDRVKRDLLSRPW